MRFSNCGDFLKTVRESLLVIGLLTGGAWAVFVFVVEEHATLAKLNATKLQMETKSLQDQWQSNLDLTLTVSSSKAKTRPGFYIQALVTLHNKGKLKDEFILSKHALRLYRVTFDGAGKPQHGEVILRDQVSMPQPASRALLLPGESARFPFVHYTEQAGLYYMDFSVQTSPKNLQIWPAEWIKPDKKYRWMDGQFVDVGSAGL